jgi:hypothetical protein
MVVVHTKETLKDFAGLPLKDGDKEITNGAILVNALTMPRAGDENVSGEEKLKRYELARKLYTSEVVDLTSEQVVTLRELVSKTYSVVVTGQILEWLK